MEDQIERILDRIHTLDDLSADDVIELRRLSERSLVLDKFKVSPRGPGWMHEAATWSIFGKLFRELEDRLSAVTGSRYFLTGNRYCYLSGDFDGSTKQPDASITKSGARWPAVVLEVGISETTSRLYQDAERWLEGSNHQTKLVILVDVQETPRWKTSNNNWGLSEVDFQQANHDRLWDHILQWYRSKGIRLHGSFNVSVHLRYSDNNRQCILHKAAFSPGNLIDLTTINDVPLRLEHLMSAGSELDVGQPLLFPLRHLVDTLQNGFGAIEIERAGHLATNKLKNRQFPSGRSL